MVISQKLFWILFCLLIIAAVPAIAQDSDCRCLPVFPVGGSCQNLDSIMLDTCGQVWLSCENVALSLDGAKLKNLLYAKNKYELEFDVPAIVLPPVSSDSIVDVTWDRIDAIYESLRAGFKK